MKIYYVATEFSRTPGSRYRREGKFSGEEFRTEHLVPWVKDAILRGKEILVDLDGTAGFGTSFLEEAFGGLIRNDKFSLSELNRVMRVQCTDEAYLVEDISDYMREAQEQCDQQAKR